MSEEKPKIVYSGQSGFDRIYKSPQRMVRPSYIQNQLVGKTKGLLGRTRGGLSFIHLDTYASAGEIIEVGKGRLQYKIVKDLGQFKYRIKRTDGNKITAADYLTIKKGDKVYFMDRLSGMEMLEMYYELNGEDLNKYPKEEDNSHCNTNDFSRNKDCK